MLLINCVIIIYSPLYVSGGECSPALPGLVHICFCCSRGLPTYGCKNWEPMDQLIPLVTPWQSGLSSSSAALMGSVWGWPACRNEVVSCTCNTLTVPREVAGVRGGQKDTWGLDFCGERSAGPRGWCVQFLLPLPAWGETAMNLGFQKAPWSQTERELQKKGLSAEALANSAFMCHLETEVCSARGRGSSGVKAAVPWGDIGPQLRTTVLTIGPHYVLEGAVLQATCMFEALQMILTFHKALWAMF